MGVVGKSVGSCVVCFHPLVKDIDRFMRDGAFNGTIASWIGVQATKRADGMRTPNKDTLKRHRERHLGLPPLRSGNVDDDRQQGIVNQEPVESVSNEDIYGRARARLAGQLDNLTPKELHTLVIEGMKLERAKALGGRRDDDEDAPDAAAADDAARAVARLHIAS